MTVDRVPLPRIREQGVMDDRQLAAATAAVEVEWFIQDRLFSGSVVAQLGPVTYAGELLKRVDRFLEAVARMEEQ